MRAQEQMKGEKGWLGGVVLDWFFILRLQAHKKHSSRGDYVLRTTLVWASVPVVRWLPIGDVLTLSEQVNDGETSRPTSVTA